MSKDRVRQSAIIILVGIVLAGAGIFILLLPKKERPALPDFIHVLRDTTGLDAQAWRESREDFPGAKDAEIADYQRARKAALLRPRR